MFFRSPSLILFTFALAFISSFSYAGGLVSYQVDITDLEDRQKLISEKVSEPYNFFGLASYYNKVNYYFVNADGIEEISEKDTKSLSEGEYLAAVGRFNILLIEKNNSSFSFGSEAKETQGAMDNNLKGYLLSKRELKTFPDYVDEIRYIHLWPPIATLARGFEWILDIINSYVSHWALTIIIFSILLKLSLLPVGILIQNQQVKARKISALLEPQLQEIKKNYDGEEAHQRIMKAHKDLGVSPFYSLKPLSTTLIQVPILIAIFNALGEMPHFDGTDFLWIQNLAYPDRVTDMPHPVPMLGISLSILPFLMTLVSIYSNSIFSKSLTSNSEIRRQKYNIYFMSAAFFVLFYPFPAVMVLFWTLMNILQLIQHKVLTHAD